MTLSNLTAWDEIPDGSLATPGLWNTRFSSLSQSIDQLNSGDFTSGSNLTLTGSLWFNQSNSQVIWPDEVGAAVARFRPSGNTFILDAHAGGVQVKNGLDTLTVAHFKDDGSTDLHGPLSIGTATPWGAQSLFVSGYDNYAGVARFENRNNDRMIEIHPGSSQIDSRTRVAKTQELAIQRESSGDLLLCEGGGTVEVASDLSIGGNIVNTVVVQRGTLPLFLQQQNSSDDQTAAMISGTGSPEGVISSGTGSIYMRMDGDGPDAALYSKVTGISTTGWYAHTESGLSSLA